MTKTKRRIRKIRELRDQGKKVREIADAMKISESYVAKLITKAGLAQHAPEPSEPAPAPETPPMQETPSTAPVLVKLLRPCPNPKFWEAEFEGVKVKCKLRKLQGASFLKKGMQVKALQENGLYQLWT